MCKLICSQVAHLERSGHYLTVKDNQVSELVVGLEEHTIRQTCIAKYETYVNIGFWNNCVTWTVISLVPRLSPRPNKK